MELSNLDNENIEELLISFFNMKSSIFKLVTGKISDDSKYETNDIIYKLLNINYRHYIHYISSNKLQYKLVANDIFQYSSFEDTNVNFSTTIKLAGNTGFSWESIGRYLLRKSDSVDTKGANVKYGENHSKTAALFGLAVIDNKRCYLTRVGYVFDSLSPKEQIMLLSRLSLRTNLVRIICHNALKSDVCFDNHVNFLAESTRKRRKNNVRTVFDLVRYNGEIDLSLIFDSISSLEGFV